MADDRKTSELIAKSLHTTLDRAEQQAIDEHLQACEQARSFSSLSQMINNSVGSVAALPGTDVIDGEPGLCDEAKLRLKSSVRQALRESRTLLANSNSPLSSEEVSIAANVADAPDLTTPREAISRFRLIRKIGEGGLGTVWLARDEKLKRNVAVKEMNHRAVESPKLWLRFHREAEITGQLEHPNVVPLYMFGVDPQTNQPFYAMRFLGKQTLSEAILEYHARREVGKADSLQLHRLLTAFLDVCQAVAYAHSRGVIHRDLKPENVALDNFGQVIVLDWGLAKVVSDTDLSGHISLTDAEEDSDWGQTLAGEIVGTPLYMAPEQAAGDLKHVDERTDVYGLGAILFAILTGCAPHEKSNTSTEGGIRVQDVLKAIANSATPLPRQYNSAISRELEAICVQAMSRERFVRHASALDLANDVEHWMAGQHERRQRYDAVRLEGARIRANLVTSFRDFARNVRFMSHLPPIQGLIDADREGNQDELTVWRERLSVIFHGLLQANCDFSAVSYCRFEGDQRRELVRLERHRTDLSSIRSVPRSRLETGEANEFAKETMRQKPDDTHIGLCASCERVASCVLVAAGVPVFDETTEEPYGYVVIESDFACLAQAQVGRRMDSSRIVIVDQEGTILFDSDSSSEEFASQAPQGLANWLAIRNELNKRGEHINADHEIYATQFALVPGGPKLTIVMFC